MIGKRMQRRERVALAGVLVCSLLGSVTERVYAENPAQNAGPNLAENSEPPGGGSASLPQDEEHGGFGPGRDRSPDGGPDHNSDRGPCPCASRGFGRPGWEGSPSGGRSRATTSTMRGGLQLGPPGRWWDDPQFAGELRLSVEQQGRMDAIFARSKADLFARYSALRDEEQQLGSQTGGSKIDEAVLFAHIDRVSKARAELEKANAHMLLQLRQELTPDQVVTLDAHRPGPPLPH